MMNQSFVVVHAILPFLQLRYSQTDIQAYLTSISSFSAIVRRGGAVFFVVFVSEAQEEEDAEDNGKTK